MASNDYRLFQKSYTDRATKQGRLSPTWHVAFRDHLNRRQSLAASPRRRQAETFANKLMELVECRREGRRPADNSPLQKWIDSQPAGVTKRLAKMELIDRRAIDPGKPLALHLDVYQQDRQSRGGDVANVMIRTNRARRILNGCNLTYWRDLSDPGAATVVSIFLGELRESGAINGQSFNYYVRDLKAFCQWMIDRGAPGPALSALEPVANAATDSEHRRALTVAEMRLLLAVCTERRKGEDGKMHDPPTIQGMSGPERAFLYRFAFETGMRPGQIRALKVADFDLESDPPTVTTHAKYVKSRKTYAQVLRPALAAELRKLFATKLPAAAAIKMPSKYHMADMTRRDLADARAKWIEDAKGDDKERERRQRSDFLAAVNDRGEVAVFYSTRHGHGNALSDAGVPERDIAASMHHSSRRTTARYLHASRESIGRAIASMPDLTYAQPQAATGTDDAGCFRSASATAATLVDSNGQSDPAPVELKPLDSGRKTAQNAMTGQNQGSGLLAELADAMDSKSIADTPKTPENTAKGEDSGWRFRNASAARASGDLSEVTRAGRLSKGRGPDLARAWRKIQAMARRGD